MEKSLSLNDTRREFFPRILLSRAIIASQHFQEYHHRRRL